MWKIVEEKGIRQKLVTYQLDSASDISDPPADTAHAAPGSVAYTPDLAHIYMKANDGTWTEIEN